MLLWRISDFADLTGVGGTLSDGRWHARLAPIIYAADTSALAMLEVLVNLSMRLVPRDYQLLRIEAEDIIEVTAFPDPAVPPISVSRAWGDRWLAEAATPLARVPSALAPYCTNILINPAHPAAVNARIAEVSHWPWDARLFRARV